MCYHSQNVKPEDQCSPSNIQGILLVPECSDQVEYLAVLDSENPESKVCEEQQVTEQNSKDISNQKTLNKLNITDHSDQWKLPALVHNCQDSDSESAALNTCQHFSTYRVPQYNIPDIYQNGPWVISYKDMESSSQTSCTCSIEQNEVSVTPDGLMEDAEPKQKADCKRKLTVKQQEDYSQVSGIYRETVLVIQKDSSPVQRHTKRNDDDPGKKTKTEITSSAKDSTDTQEYVVTL